jgi:hypothetical protein
MVRDDRVVKNVPARARTAERFVENDSWLKNAKISVCETIHVHRTGGIGFIQRR